MILTYFFCLASFLFGWLLCALFDSRARNRQLDRLKERVDNFTLIQTQKKVPEDISTLKH